MHRRHWICCITLAWITGCGIGSPAGPGGPVPNSTSPQFVGEWGVGGIEPGQLQNPHGVAVDARGRVYVADFENRRVQKFSDAGTFLQAWDLEPRNADPRPAPRDVALDEDGRVYVADITYNRIQVFDASGRFLTSWGTAGTGPGELLRPIALAISGRRLFVADWVQRVQRFDLQGAYETGWPLYDGSVANFPNVFDMEADRNGNLWVLENQQARVRQFSPDGRLLQSLDERGATAGAFQSPLSLAIDRRGQVLIAEAEDGRVQRFDAGGMFREQWSLVPPCAAPYGSTPVAMAIMPTGRILIVDAPGDRVLQFEMPPPSWNPLWWTWGQFGVDPGALYRPRGIAVDADHQVYVCDDRPRVSVFTAHGEFLRQFGSPGDGEGQLRFPVAIAIFGDRVYVTDSINARVNVYDRAGTSLGSWTLSPGPPDDPPSPRGIATDRQGNVYVCAARARIDVFSPEGALLRSWGQAGTGPGQLFEAFDVGVASDDTVFVADPFRRVVLRFDKMGTFAGEFGAIPPEAGGPIALNVGPDDHLFVAGVRRLFEYDSNGRGLAEWGNPGHCAYQFDTPGDLAGDDAGRVFVTDPGNSRVQAFVRVYALIDPDLPPPRPEALP